MSSRFRNRFGAPGVISVIALVFAMFGGAYAASNNAGGEATASKQGPRGKQGKPGKQGKRGPTGPTGPAGAAGLQGNAGPTGPTGAAGADGADGETGATGATGANGADGAAGATGANGATGPAGPACPAGPCVLPSKATLNGTWGTASPGGAVIAPAPISFGMPMSAPPTVLFTTTTEFEGENATHCPGTTTEPKAAPGYLCAYTSGVAALTYVGGAGFPTITKGGVILGFGGASAGRAAGTWAATAP